MKFARSLIVFVCCAATSLAPAQSPSSQPATKPADAQSSLEVREWVIFTVDANQKQANDRKAYASSLPPFIESRRDTAADSDTGHAMPMGVIRFFGKIDPAAPVDVLLSPPHGEAMSSWPHAQTKPGRMLWANVTSLNAPASSLATGKAIQTIDPTHWLAPLRDDSAAAVLAEGQQESFLLYDFSIPWPPPVRLKLKDAVYRIENTGAAPLHDVAIYKKQNDHWLTANIAAINGISAGPSTPAVKPDTGGVFEPATTQPTTLPKTPATLTTTKPAADGVAKNAASAALADSNSPDKTALLDPWRQILSNAGLAPGDITVAMKVLADNALDNRWLTLVYRLDSADLDRVMPLEILPAPAKITRVGLVIVRGLDPAVLDEVDHLITQCGDPSYAKRKEATAALIEIGELAKPKLEKAQSNPDIEIAQRAEAALSAIGKSKSDGN